MALDKQHYFNLGVHHCDENAKARPFRRDSATWQAKAYWDGFDSRTTPTGRSLPHLEAEFSAVVHDNCQKNLMQLAREPGKRAWRGKDFTMCLVAALKAPDSWPSGARAHYDSVLKMMATEPSNTKRFARLQRALHRLNARWSPKPADLMWVDEAN